MTTRRAIQLAFPFLFSVLTIWSVQGFAQDEETSAADDEDTTEATVLTSTDEDVVEDEEVDDAEVIEEIVVTGSRLKRSTFESISPLQIIDAEVSRESGLVETTDMLQKSTQASGQQVDTTYTGYVLDNGPGAATVDLRGLAADRTLVLVNGRRLAPSGVEGAPSSPDLNVIPGSLIQRVDLLLDGASSIYGSDAIAGVANVILRKDFDGLEFDMYAEQYDYAGKSFESFTITYGKNFERGVIGFAYSNQEFPHITYRDGPWTNTDCTENVEIDENGQFRSQDVYWKEVFGMDFGNCKYTGGLAGRIVVPFAGSIYHTPGRSNGGWGVWSESNTTVSGQTFYTDDDGDGYNDVNFRDYSDDYLLDGSLYQSLSRKSIMAYGEYTFDTDANITPYYEVLHAKRKNYSYANEYQLFPVVPALNPYNPCNPFAPGGVDCGLAYDEFVNNASLNAAISEHFELPPGTNVIGTGGLIDRTRGPIGPQPVRMIARVKGDRNAGTSEVEQTRFVTGVTADLPWEIGSLSGWSMDLVASYTRSIGVTSRFGIHEDKIALALGSFSLSGQPCSQSALTEPLPLSVSGGCLPVNVFAPSLYPLFGAGDFATQRERDYLMVERTFDTRYRQGLYSLNVTGSLFDMKYGSVLANLGVEWRKDHIASIPNEIASAGRFIHFQSDEGAYGRKTTKEAFVEVEVPLLSGLAIAKDLTVNLSGRLTNDEYYGSANTWSSKVGYRPLNSILIRGTMGTSYRAPNLRNLFLAGQTGFNTYGDPCLIPENALDTETGDYVPSLDTREQIVLDNCAKNGIDPTAWSLGFNSYSVELLSGGSLTLDPETSDSVSVGFVFEQPFTNLFDLTVGASAYEIDVYDTIIEPSAGYIIYDCYNNLTGSSVFCSRIERDDTPGEPPLMELIDRGFINRDHEAVRGIDFNLRFTYNFTLMDRPFTYTMDGNAHRLLERSTLLTNDVGDVDEQEYRGEWGYHRTKGRVNNRLEFGNWRVSWNMRIQGELFQDLDGVDEFDEALTGIADTCSGPPDDVLCRDWGDADYYIEHSVSVRYSGLSWGVLAGVSNATNEAPPKVDSTEVFSLKNRPYGGYGYDLLGRTAFVSFSYTFENL